jgi:hypothetical protein
MMRPQSEIDAERCAAEERVRELKAGTEDYERNRLRLLQLCRESGGVDSLRPGKPLPFESEYLIGRAA